MMLIIGKYQEARDYADEHKLGAEGVGWRLINNPWQLRGLEGPKHNPDSRLSVVKISLPICWANHARLNTELKARGF